jgi:thiol-disulfide isomerase/thioredoxin
MNTKFNLFFPSLLLGLFFLIAGCSPRGYVIKGTISGAEDKTVYLLTGRDEFNRVVVDSTVIKNGHFEFKGELAYPELLTVKIFPTHERAIFTPCPVIPVLVDKGTVSIEAILDSIPLATLSRDYDYSRVRVRASRLHDLHVEYNQRKTTLVNAKNEAWQDYYQQYLKAKGNIPVLEGIAERSKVDKAAADLLDYVKQCIARNRDNTMGLHVFRDNLGYKSLSLGLFTVAEVEEILASFSPEIKKTEFYKQVTNEANEAKKTLVGARYVDFTLQDLDGKPVKLSDHVGKGKYVLLEFWASWCGPCRADIPHLKKVYELYHPEGFEVISISMDAEKNKWLKAVEDEQMPWLQLSGEQDVQEELTKIYHAEAIPACVLVSPDGIIVTYNMRDSWMDRKLIELYGNKFSDKD